MAREPVWQAGWAVDPMEAGRRIDERYSDSGAGALLVWAAWTVEGMYYLADVDASLPRPPYAGHNHEAVDLSHARWATVDAVTAIDLCAASLGRMHCDYPKKGREMDFGISRENSALLALPAPGEWMRAVCADDQYEQVRGLRDALVHRTARRRIEVTISSSLSLTGVGGGARTSRARLHLSDPAAAIPVEDLVPRCRDVAQRHVGAFMAARDSL
jgi:hypothetical protein